MTDNTESKELPTTEIHSNNVATENNNNSNMEYHIYWLVLKYLLGFVLKLQDLSFLKTVNNTV